MKKLLVQQMKRPRNLVFVFVLLSCFILCFFVPPIVGDDPLRLPDEPGMVINATKAMQLIAQDGYLVGQFPETEWVETNPWDAFHFTVR